MNQNTRKLNLITTSSIIAYTYISIQLKILITDNLVNITVIIALQPCGLSNNLSRRTTKGGEMLDYCYLAMQRDTDGGGT